MASTLRFSNYAEAEDVAGQAPDVVFLATGGVPNTDVLEHGNDLVISTWDILSGAVEARPQRVLVYDDNGAHPAMQAAELLAEAGSSVEIVTPERLFRAGDRRPQPRRLRRGVPSRAACGSRSTRGCCRCGATATSWSPASARDHGPERFERLVDQVVVEHGTLPLVDLYRALRPLSCNRGEVDYAALVAGPAADRGPQSGRCASGCSASAMPWRAATSTPPIYDGLRLAKDI